MGLRFICNIKKLTNGGLFFLFRAPSRRLCALARIFRAVLRFYELRSTTKHHEILVNKPETRNQELKIPLSNSNSKLELSPPKLSKPPEPSKPSQPISYSPRKWAF